MKPLVLILCLCVAAVAGSVGGIFVIGSPSDTTGEASLAITSAKKGNTADLAQRIDAVAQDLSDLRIELMRLKEGTARAPAIAEAPAAVHEEVQTRLPPQQRTAILKIIAEDREEQARLKEEERQKQVLQGLLTRADRVAKQLKLGEVQQKSLADVYVLERQRMDELRNNTNALDQQASRDAFRAGMNELRDWRTAELTKRLGADIAQQIEGVDPMRGGRGGGGPGGGGPGGPGGNGGQPGGQ